MTSIFHIKQIFWLYPVQSMYRVLFLRVQLVALLYKQSITRNEVIWCFLSTACSPPTDDSLILPRDLSIVCTIVL